ncbi:23S rRNA (uracil(1939)-C(5))-methyltransferase RlmD [bacterium]|nr:23S rRNA (uracil(1939)-C(5))-methyltransferase RlmD [bacterium]
MKSREILELEIESLAFGCRGVSREDGFVWFVDRALPGQRVKAEVLRRRKQYGEASLAEVLRPSPFQITPPCPYFGTCGGCQAQHLAYPVQVEAKTGQIVEILQRIGGIRDARVMPAKAASRIFGYRNKMEFTCSDRHWRPDGPGLEDPHSFAVGLHVPRRFDKILDIEACLLQSQEANRLLGLCRKAMAASGLNPYNLKDHTGFWRFLIIREGFRTGERMLHIITSGREGSRGTACVDGMAVSLLRDFPDLTTIVHGISDRTGQVAWSETERVLHGPGFIHEKILGKMFEISPASFFQTNTLQADTLIETLIELGRFRGDETVFDLYCGTGAIGICMADRVRRVVGIEVIESAVANARRNAESNGTGNIEFIRADMKEALRGRGGTRPDIVILDPPRGGAHPRTIRDILELEPARILYVSCNPPMLAKDIQHLSQDYSLEAVQPVDMFPHTRHIEAVAALSRTGSRIATTIP